MKQLRVFLIALFALPAVAAADIAVRVPVVTQVQGVVFFRTSLAIANGSGGRTAGIQLRFSYRSPVDGSFQNANLDAGPLAPHRTLFFEDIVQHLKNSGAIRPQDAASGLFGTLLVTFDANGYLVEDAIAEARTYSAAGGGTNGIAYVGRESTTAGAHIVKGALRNGAFGADGTTRANLGFVNEGGGGTTDIDVTYYDGATGATLKQFRLASLLVGEVVQLNNIFTDPSVPPGTRSLVVTGQGVANGARISGYGVQIDSATQDGSFFLLIESGEGCGGYVPPL